MHDPVEPSPAVRSGRHRPPRAGVTGAAPADHSGIILHPPGLWRIMQIALSTPCRRGHDYRAG